MTLDNLLKSSNNTPDALFDNVGIRIDCYAAVIQKFRKSFPNAYFEIVMRSPKSCGIECPPSVLSPSWELLKSAKAKGDFQDYAKKLEYELFQNSNAVRRMHELKKIAESKLVFLVCSEKDPNQCHRSLLKDWIEHIEEKWKIWKVRGFVR